MVSMNDKPRSASAAIAKWGAACAPCATAKAKCIRSNETVGARCDRCERLEKDCADQIHRPRKKRQNKPSKTAQLEERLNNLVELIKASNAGELPTGLNATAEDVQCIPTRAGANLVQDMETSTAKEASERQSKPRISRAEWTRPVPEIFNDHAPVRCICRAPTGDIPVPVQSADELLSIYVNKIAPQYPFVALRPGTTVTELEETRPLLFAGIKMVSSVLHLRSMRAQAYPIIKHISEQVLVRSERSLELVQTIVLILSSYHYHCMMHSQMGSLASLAQSLVADLSINRPPEIQERQRVLLLNPEIPKARTNDERRALCGVWYINSIVALCFGKMEPPRYTPYIARCVRELEAEREYESDLVLVNLMRIQKLSDGIAQTQASESAESLPEVPRAPVSAYYSAFQQELDDFMTKLPRQLKSHKFLMIHYHTAMLRLWEPLRVDSSLVEKLSRTFTALSFEGPSTLDALYKSNAALKAWFECWLSVGISEYFYMPMPACAHLIVAVMMLSRWAKLSCADPHIRRSSALSSAASKPGRERQPEQMWKYEADCDTDSKPPASGTINFVAPDASIPAALATLKTSLLSQPEFYIDVIGILRALVVRFDEARGKVSEIRDGKLESNVWELAAKKINITRLKIERWAEIVDTIATDSPGGKGEPSTGDERSTQETSTRDSSPGAPNGSIASGAVAGAGAGPMMGLETTTSPDFMMQEVPDGWQYNNMVAHDIFDGLGLDQNFFYDDNMSYGNVIWNNLGPMPP